MYDYIVWYFYYNFMVMTCDNRCIMQKTSVDRVRCTYFGLTYNDGYKSTTRSC